AAAAAAAAAAVSRNSTQRQKRAKTEIVLQPMPTPLPLPMQPRAARPVAFERHTKQFGSRFLEKYHFDGATSGARENEYVATFADRTLAGQRERGGVSGGLGYSSAAAEAAARADREPPQRSISAPCDMDASLNKGNPPKSYYGITVEFPFETPMVPQGQMMQRIIAALKSGKHALLESPTGTGKSAAMLCATLAWQRDELFRTGKAPQIFYGARTHTQLVQMAKTLKTLPYVPTMATLGSRARLCINPMVVGDDLADGEQLQDDDDDDAHAHAHAHAHAGRGSNSGDVHHQEPPRRRSFAGGVMGRGRGGGGEGPSCTAGA
ncbi:unnamed protein product, partial [Pylaiella littoralis]